MTALTTAAVAMMAEAERDAAIAALDRNYGRIAETLERGAQRVADEMARWDRISGGSVTAREAVQ